MDNYQARGYLKYAINHLDGTEEELTLEQKRKLLGSLLLSFDMMTEQEADKYDDRHWKGLFMDHAVEYAKKKITMFPDVYKDYINDSELFQILVDDCRKQLEFESFSKNLLRIGSEKGYEQSVIW